ncbi:MAG: hypothetical protein WCQ66_02100 [Sphaerochaetaceae bacterium]|jgi:hypothetical protein
MTSEEKRNAKACAVAVGLSVLFSYLDLLSLLYIIPVIVVSVLYRDGRRILPALASGTFVVAFALVGNRGGFGTETGRLAILVTLFIPVVLWISALIWIGLDGKRFLIRYLALSLFVVVASLSLLLVFSHMKDVSKVLDDFFSKTFVQVFQGIAGTTDLDATGNAQLTSLYHMVVQVMGALIVPMMMTICGIDIFLALLIQQRGSDGLTRKVMAWHLPQDLVWGFLGLWILVMLGHFLSWSYVGMAVAINLAGFVTVLYGMQGFAILLFWLRKRHARLSAGKLFGWVLVLLLFLPGVNMIGVVALPVVGVLETWFVFRRRDKEISYENHS